MRKDSATTDSEGQPAFTLINKATNQAIKHDATPGPVSLVRFLGSDDNSVLWTESKTDNQGFRHIRRAGSIPHHLVASRLEMYDGRIVDLSTGDNMAERWKFAPYTPEKGTPQVLLTISCQAKDGYNLTIRDDTAMLAPADSNDKYQIWVKETTYGKLVKDDDNKRAFALVNLATGKAIKFGVGPRFLVQLAPFNRNNLDSSLLWTELERENGLREIRYVINRTVNLQAFYVDEQDSNKALLAAWPRNDRPDQRWRLQQVMVWNASDIASMTAETAPGCLCNPDDAKGTSGDNWNPSGADISFENGKLVLK